MRAYWARRVCRSWSEAWAATRPQHRYVSNRARGAEAFLHLTRERVEDAAGLDCADATATVAAAARSGPAAGRGDLLRPGLHSTPVALPGMPHAAVRIGARKAGRRGPATSANRAAARRREPRAPCRAGRVRAASRKASSAKGTVPSDAS
jgi:hypothetical protein